MTKRTVILSFGFIYITATVCQDELGPGTILPEDILDELEKDLEIANTTSNNGTEGGRMADLFVMNSAKSKDIHISNSLIIFYSNLTQNGNCDTNSNHPLMMRIFYQPWQGLIEVLVLQKFRCEPKTSKRVFYKLSAEEVIPVAIWQHFFKNCHCNLNHKIMY